MYKYMDELLNFCKNHIKNYSITESTDGNNSIIRFENTKDNFNVIVECREKIQKLVVDKKEFNFTDNDSVAKRINTMFKEIMERVRV